MLDKVTQTTGQSVAPRNQARRSQIHLVDLEPLDRGCPEDRALPRPASVIN